MPEFAEFDINDDILHINPIKFHEAQANMATFHSWNHNCTNHTFNGLYNNQVEFDFSSGINQIETEQNEIEILEKKDNPYKLVYVTKLVNEHRNHDFDQAYYNFQENIAFTTEMTKDYNESALLYYSNIGENESWAKAFVLKLFMAGMSSISQVESYNTKLKRLIFNSNMTILELAEKLTACILEEDKKTEDALF
ncbi:19821_t:CDS:2 [Gigaspora margarita]|uniref:19821_t:CDS:1 n=1 Tax=Gigaspora margarita TaxID=4874 RepID=A0ABN7VSA5_GIGMA|nr:19821_t:CDS:2 [Gigaspora margarita]